MNKFFLIASITSLVTLISSVIGSAYPSVNYSLVKQTQIQLSQGFTRNHGLRRAFAIAGSQSQLMTLWKVNDEATSLLMVKYYQRLMNQEARSLALRQTQLEMLNSQN